MVSGYVDAFLIACPSHEQGIDAFHQYVLDLLRWREIREQRGIMVFASSHAYDVLTATDSYPLWEPLKRSLAALQVEHVQPKDVVDVAHSLLTKAVVIEDQLGLSDFLYDECACTLPWASGSRDQRFDEFGKDLGVAICFNRQRIGDDQSRHLIFTRGCIAGSTLAIQANVEDAEGPSRDEYAWPVTAKGTFGIVVDPATVLVSVDVAEIFSEAIRRQDSGLLVTALVEALRRREREDRPWSINTHFYTSIWALIGAGKASLIRAVIRACVETVVDENMAATHQLRRGHGANEPQKIRDADKAGAWRRDIDHEYHLHYWVTSNGPELAAVVVHVDSSIPD